MAEKLLELKNSNQFAGDDIPLSIPITAADSNSIVGTQVDLVIEYEGVTLLSLSTTDNTLTKTTETASAITVTGKIPRTLTTDYPNTTLEYYITVLLPNDVKRTLESESFHIAKR